MLNRKTAVNVLRDPVWQAIGTIVALITLVIGFATNPKETSELSVYHYHKIKFKEYLLPADKIKLILLGSSEEINRAVVDYYVIVNNSKRPILSSDFTSRLTVAKGEKTEKIFLVSSCNTIASDYPQDGTRTKIALNWSQTNEKWQAEPTLLNPRDYACITIISEESEAQDKTYPPSQRFAWEGRIVNIQVRAFDSAEDYAKTHSQHWSNYLETVVVLVGFMPYWFVGLQLLLFVATMILAREASWITTYDSIGLAKVAFVVALSTGSAESLISLFSFNFDQLHPAVAIFVIMHLVLSAYLALKAKRQRAPSEIVKN